MPTQAIYVVLLLAGLGVGIGAIIWMCLHSKSQRNTTGTQQEQSIR